MKRFTSLILATVISLGISQLGFATESYPSFVQKGSSYRFIVVGAGRVEVVVEKVDKDSGWVKVQSEKFENGWVNLSQITAIIPL